MAESGAIMPPKPRIALRWIRATRCDQGGEGSSSTTDDFGPSDQAFGGPYYTFRGGGDSGCGSTGKAGHIRFNGLTTPWPP